MIPRLARSTASDLISAFTAALLVRYAYSPPEMLLAIEPTMLDSVTIFFCALRSTYGTKHSMTLSGGSTLTRSVSRKSS